MGIAVLAIVFTGCQGKVLVADVIPGPVYTLLEREKVPNSRNTIT